MEPINVLGKPCPIPVIEAKKALRKAAPGEEVRILVDNDISRQNLEKMAKGYGCAFSYETRDDGSILVAITAGTGPAAAPNAAPAPVPKGRGLVVAIGKNTMGSGNDEVGALIMKNFLYCLTELDTPPESLLFFNSGVYLVAEDSDALKDLKTLEAKGTVIASCATCLDFFQLRDKMAVGSVTNMLAIASAMGEADKLINL
jgi:selenium metabolism protein YedF